MLSFICPLCSFFFFYFPNFWTLVQYCLYHIPIVQIFRVTLDLLSVQSNNDIPWARKKSQAFWRGRDSRRERLDLIDMARQNKHLINASLTNFFFFKDEESKYGPKEKHVSFFKFFDVSLCFYHFLYLFLFFLSYCVPSNYFIAWDYL